MDASRVQEIVERHLVPLRSQLALNTWRITFTYGPTDPAGNTGTCTRKAEYLNAHIVIDPHEHETDEEVFDTLVHELLHIVLSPFDLYMWTMFEAIKGNPQLEAIEDKQFQHAVESTLGNVMLMLRTSNPELFVLLDEDDDDIVELVPDTPRLPRLPRKRAA